MDESRDTRLARLDQIGNQNEMSDFFFKSHIFLFRADLECVRESRSGHGCQIISLMKIKGNKRNKRVQSIGHNGHFTHIGLFQAPLLCYSATCNPMVELKAGVVGFAPKWVRFAPNGTNPGLFQIRFQCIWRPAPNAQKSDL